MIYKRFTEKAAEEWRQIYKALQLMEFLVKNGSERVIDDARSHLSLLKMLRQFHFIDQNGKDQGINVRNRSKELTDLLSDVEKIRAERKKARATRNKYGGVEGGSGFGMGGAGSQRYGGFGSEDAGYGGTFGGTTRGVYGDGGGFGGESHEEYDEGGRRAEKFEEYDEYDDGGTQAPPSRRKSGGSRTAAAAKRAEPAKAKQPEVDLFDFGDEPAQPIAAPSNGASSSAILSPPISAPAPADDDDFDDFQSASPASSAPPPLAAPSIPAPNYSSISTATPSSATQYAQPTPQQGTQKADFSNLFSTTSQTSSTSATPSASSAFSPPASQPKPTGYQPTGPNYFTSVQVQPSQQHPVGTPGSVSSPPAGSVAAGKKPAGGDAFASLLSGSGMKKAGTPTQKGMTIADMAKQKSQAGLYGANAQPMAFQQPRTAGQKPSTGSSGLDDLLG
jgi:epsin